MKVILLQDVSGVGVRGDLKEVADGYGTNFLIPQKLAKFASPQMIAEARKFSRRKATRHIKSVGKTEHLLKKLDGGKVTVDGKVNDKGHLFAQIHESDIATAIKEQLGVDAKSFKIEMPETIKEVGEFKITVSMTGSKKIALSVLVKEGK